MLPIKSAVLVGSLRKESFSRKVAKALFAITPKSVSLEILEIRQLPNSRLECKQTRIKIDRLSYEK